jgi:hypothetical protein
MRARTKAHEKLKAHITNSYKGLLEEYEEGSFSMDENQTNDIPKYPLRRIT